VAAEQDYLTLLYQHLDERRRYTARRLAEVLRAPTTGTPQALSERDAAAAMYSAQLTTLNGVEQGLCFGRLDLDPDAVGDPDAIAEDGVVEGIEDPRHRFCLGVQWHPEFEINDADRRIFRAFVGAAGG
jgi:hypothetical protein